MNENSFLLDTNVVIGLLENDSSIRVRVTNGMEIHIPSIVLGELYFGAYKSNRVRENVRHIDGLCSSRRIIPCDSGTARVYGQIRDELRMKGRPIPMNDTWIAALARQHEWILVTRDAHFHEVQGIRIDVW